MAAAGVAAKDLTGPGAGDGGAAVDEEEGSGAEFASVGGGDVEIWAAFEDVWAFGFEVDEIARGGDHVGYVAGGVG